MGGLMCYSRLTQTSHDQQQSKTYGTFNFVFCKNFHVSLNIHIYTHFNFSLFSVSREGDNLPFSSLDAAKQRSLQTLPTMDYQRDLIKV